MPFIIITRHCNLGITGITYCTDPNEPNPPIMEFDDEESAEAIAENNPLCNTFGYEIVWVDL